MFEILPDKTICITRGDAASIEVSAKRKKDGQPYTFTPGDVLRFQIYKKRDCNCILLRKDVEITEEASTGVIYLSSEDTEIGEVYRIPVDYCYEVKLNPDTKQQTIIGHDKEGEKIFRLYPEGSDDD